MSMGSQSLHVGPLFDQCYTHTYCKLKVNNTRFSLSMFSEHSSHLSQHQLSCCSGNEARLCAMQPNFVIPTVVANWDPAMRRGGGQLDDLDYSIGHEALSKASSSSLTYPIKHGMVIPPQKATQKAVHNFSFWMILSGLSNQHTSFTSILSCRHQGTFAFNEL